jgi:uncharacterized membrane protein
VKKILLTKIKIKTHTNKLLFPFNLIVLAISHKDLKLLIVARLNDRSSDFKPRHSTKIFWTNETTNSSLSIFLDRFIWSKLVKYALLFSWCFEFILIDSIITSNCLDALLVSIFIFFKSKLKLVSLSFNADLIFEYMVKLFEAHVCS